MRDVDRWLGVARRRFDGLGGTHMSCAGGNAENEKLLFWHAVF